MGSEAGAGHAAPTQGTIPTSLCVKATTGVSRGDLGGAPFPSHFPSPVPLASQLGDPCSPQVRACPQDAP